MKKWNMPDSEKQMPLFALNFQTGIKIGCGGGGSSGNWKLLFTLPHIPKENKVKKNTPLSHEYYYFFFG